MPRDMPSTFQSEVIWLSLWLLLLTGCRAYRINQLYQRSELAVSEGKAPLEARLSQGHFFVKAEIQGREGWFLWDTGADLTVLDETWAEGLSLRRVARGIVNDAQRRRQRLRICEIGRMSLSGHQFTRVGAILADLRALELCEFDLAGIIGQTVIYRAHWEIRFSDSTLTLSDAPFPLSEQAAHLPLTMRKLSPYFTLNITREPLLCKLDYGSTGGIDLPLNKSSVRDLLAQHPSRRYVGAGRGLFGWAPPDTGFLLWTDSVRLGSMPVPATELDLSHQTRTKIGTEVLSRYDAVLNFEEAGLWLHSLEQPLPAPEAVFGVYLRWVDTSLVIQTLADLSGTAGEDLVPLQPVKALQGRPASDFSDHCDFLAWRNQLWEQADTIQLTLPNDSTLDLTRRVPPERSWGAKPKP